jgi:hypothetical protein
VAWLTAEHRVLLAAVDRAAATGFDTLTWQLAWALAVFLDRRGHWHDWADVGRAERLADPTAHVSAHRHLAGAYTLLGRLDDAHIQLSRALDLATRAGDPLGQALIHRGLTYLWERRGPPRGHLTTPATPSTCTGPPATGPGRPAPST